MAGGTPLALATEVVVQAMEAQAPMDSRAREEVAHFPTAAMEALGMAVGVRVVIRQASLVVEAVVVLTSPQLPSREASLPVVAAPVARVPQSIRRQEPMEAQDQ